MSNRKRVPLEMHSRGEPRSGYLCPSREAKWQPHHAVFIELSGLFQAPIVSLVDK